MTLSANSEPQCTVEEFCSKLATALDISPQRLRACTSLAADLPLDELLLAKLVIVIQGINPHFHIPEQVDLHDIGFADLYHFCCTMSEGHRESG